MWKLQLMSKLVAEDSELMPHRTKLNLCDDSQSVTISSATNSPTTRTSTKTSSKRSKKA